MKRGEARPTRFRCNVSIFCQYLLPIADTVPGRCPCQEEVCTPGGSCPGWPYLEQQGQISQHGAEQGNKTHRRKRKLAKKKHQIHFAALLVKLQVNMTAELCSLFQETHFAWQLLPLFVLIDKKLRQFLRARTSNTSRRANRVGPGDSLFIYFFFFLSSNDDQYVVFPTHSCNHPILPPLNTQTRI